MQFEIDLN